MTDIPATETVINSIPLGDIEDQVKAVQHGSAMVLLDNLGLIRVAGEDTVTFLHNLLTNDINGLLPGELRRAGFCTPKGRLLADFLIWRDQQDFFLLLPKDILPGMLKKLTMYVLRAKVKLVDVSLNYSFIGISGSNESDFFGHQTLFPSVGLSSVIDGVVLLGLPTAGVPRCLAVVPQSQIESVWQKLASQSTVVGHEAWALLDVLSGNPQIVTQTQEAFIPQMINYQQVGGLNFKKGCYPGQEIVARTQYLGKIKRRMFMARIHCLSSEQIEVGADVFAPETGDQACGKVVTVAASDKLGELAVLLVAQLSCAEKGELHIAQVNGPVAVLAELPYSVD